MFGRRLVALALLVQIIAIASPEAVAQETVATPATSSMPQFNIRAANDQPNPWFEATLDAGEMTTLTALISNVGENEVEVRSYATNAGSAVNGGFSAGTEEDEPQGATLWVDYPSETFTIQSGTTQEVTFTVQVPTDTPPGDYIAALIVQTAAPVAIPGSEIFDQIIRSAVSIEITVPGEMTSGFDLGEPVGVPTGTQWAVDIPITNTGTSHLRPQGEFVLTTPVNGDVVSTSQVEMGLLYGGNTTIVRIVLPEQLPLGNYLVSLDLVDQATGATASVVDIPVTLAEEQEAPVFVVDVASVAPNADPIQYADVAATITNNGQAIPTANVTLVAYRDGETVESYPLAANQALPQGTTEFSQRYIPIDGWQSGTWTFELVISAVSGGTETVLATVEITDDIIIP